MSPGTSHNPPLKPWHAPLRVAVLALLAGLAAAPARATCASDSLLPAASFQAVSALGDILLGDGRRLRLAGIDWPHDPRARARLRAEISALLGGETLGLAHGGPPDRWRREAAQLFVLDAARPPLWVQGELIENGLAQAWPEPAARACRQGLAERAMLARDGRLGLWSALGRRSLKRLSRAAPGMSPLPRLVYEARVRSVRRGRAVTFVNFVGPRGRTPSLHLNPARMQEFKRQGRDPATFTGKHIRVFADTDGGHPPRLSVAAAELIEVID